MVGKLFVKREYNPQNKRAWIIAALVLLVAFVPACLRGFMNIGWIVDKGAAKEMAESAIVREWQKYNTELELVDITFDSVIVNTMSSQMKRDYLNENSNVRYSKDGATYPNLKAYLDDMYYNIDAHIWRMYVVKGTYRVTDGNGEEYSGSYQVRIAALNGIYWNVEIPKIPLLEEVRRYH